MRLIDLDHASTELAYLVDLLAALADDGTDHIVRNIDLLGDGTAWHTGRDLLSVRATLWLLSYVRRHMLLTTVGPGAVGGLLSAILYRHPVRRLCSSVGILLGIRAGLHGWAATVLVMTAIVLTSAIVTRRRSRRIGNDLHAARDGAGWGTTARGVGRGGRAPETLIQLLQESASDIVGCNVNSVSDAHNDERPFTRHGKA